MNKIWFMGCVGATAINLLACYIDIGTEDEAELRVMCDDTVWETGRSSSVFRATGSDMTSYVLVAEFLYGLILVQ